MLGSPLQLDPSVHKHHAHPAGVHFSLCAFWLRPADKGQGRIFHHLELCAVERATQRRHDAADNKWRGPKRTPERRQQGGPRAAGRARHDLRQRARVQELRADGLRRVPAAHVPADFLPAAEAHAGEQRSHREESAAGTRRKVSRRAACSRSPAHECA